MQAFDIDLDMIALFSIKKCQTCNSDLNRIEQIWEYKYYWSSKTFSIRCVYNKDWGLSN